MSARVDSDLDVVERIGVYAPTAVVRRVHRHARFRQQQTRCFPIDGIVAMVQDRSPGELTEAAMQPVTQYAKSGDVHIAYQAFGDGPINLVMVPGFVSSVENYWEQPDFARFLTRLASYARVVTFDKRGTGGSDRVAELPGLDVRMDDLRAVMDAAGMEQAALLGISEGAPLSIMYAATYPHRCRAIVLYGSFSRFSYWFPTEEALETFFGYVEKAWGTGGSIQRFAP